MFNRFAGTNPGLGSVPTGMLADGDARSAAAASDASAASGNSPASDVLLAAARSDAIDLTDAALLAAYQPWVRRCA